MRRIIKKKPDLNELTHFGVPGMKWGVRKAAHLVLKGAKGVTRALDSGVRNLYYKMGEKWQDEYLKAEKDTPLTALLGSAALGLNFLRKKTNQLFLATSWKAYEFSEDAVRIKVDVDDIQRRRMLINDGRYSTESKNYRRGTSLGDRYS